MDNRPLKVKALEAAVTAIKKAVNRKQANVIYSRWEVFHQEPEFKQAVKEKLKYFKDKENENKI